MSLEADVGKPLLEVLREMMLDPDEQAAYANDPGRYMAQFGYEDVDTEHLSEAFSLVADTLPPDVAQAVADTAPGPLGDQAAGETGLAGGVDDLSDEGLGTGPGLTAVGADTADLNGIDTLRPADDGEGDGDGSFGGVDDGFDLTEGLDDVEGDGTGFGSGDFDLDDPVGDAVDDLGDIDDGVGSGDIGDGPGSGDLADDDPVDFGGGSEAAQLTELDDDGGLGQLDDGDDGFDLEDLGDGAGDTPTFDDTPDYDDGIDGGDALGVGPDDGGGHLLDGVDDGPDDGPADDPSFDDIGSF
jgi:hypothetical protein